MQKQPGLFKPWTVQQKTLAHFPLLSWDPNGDPRVSYYDAMNGDLKYAWIEVGQAGSSKLWIQPWRLWDTLLLPWAQAETPHKLL